VQPRLLIELLGDPDKAKAERVMNAMMKMTKIDVAELEKAAAGS
jgi:predicted 3-demethylubiquinone-9 3-methyltransferase (glyoxalase superfamily)